MCGDCDRVDDGEEEEKCGGVGGGEHFFCCVKFRWLYRVTAKLQSRAVFTSTQYGDCDQNRFLSSLGSHKFFYGWDSLYGNFFSSNFSFKDFW